MTLACLALSVLVYFPGVPSGPKPSLERFEVRECVQNAIMSDVSRGAWDSQCEQEANRVIKVLQYAGVLPGAHEVISYKATCDTEF